MLIRLVVAVVLSVACSASIAGVYRCTEDGKIVFRDRPCDGDVPSIPPGAIPLGTLHAQPQSSAIAAPGLPSPESLPLATRGGRSAIAIAGQVVSVADGDTLTILDSGRQQQKVSILGIDAPEKRQDYGQRSKTNLSSLAFGKQASPDCRAVDRWGRRDCLVTVDGRDVGLEQVRAGMAWWYRQYAKEQTPKEREGYERAEFDAKTHRQGLWADKNPIEPWNWRRGAKLDE